MEEIIIIDNRDFLIVKKFYYNEKNYIYAISTDGKNDVVLLEEKIVNGEELVESVRNEIEIKQVLNYMSKLK